MEKVFPLIDSAPAQVHIVSSAEIHRRQSEHAVLDAIDYRAFMVIERLTISPWKLNNQS